MNPNSLTNVNSYTPKDIENFLRYLEIPEAKRSILDFASQNPKNFCTVFNLAFDYSFYPSVGLSFEMEGLLISLNDLYMSKKDSKSFRIPSVLYKALVLLTKNNSMNNSYGNTTLSFRNNALMGFLVHLSINRSMFGVVNNCFRLLQKNNINKSPIFELFSTIYSTAPHESSKFLVKTIVANISESNIDPKIIIPIFKKISKPNRGYFISDLCDRYYSANSLKDKENILSMLSTLSEDRQLGMMVTNYLWNYCSDCPTKRSFFKIVCPSSILDSIHPSLHISIKNGKEVFKTKKKNKRKRSKPGFRRTY